MDYMQYHVVLLRVVQVPILSSIGAVALNGLCWIQAGLRSSEEKNIHPLTLSQAPACSMGLLYSVPAISRSPVSRGWDSAGGASASSPPPGPVPPHSACPEMPASPRPLPCFAAAPVAVVAGWHRPPCSAAFSHNGANTQCQCWGWVSCHRNGMAKI